MIACDNVHVTCATTKKNIRNNFFKRKIYISIKKILPFFRQQKRRSKASS